MSVASSSDLKAVKRSTLYQHTPYLLKYFSSISLFFFHDASQFSFEFVVALKSWNADEIFVSFYFLRRRLFALFLIARNSTGLILLRTLYEICFCGIRNKLRNNFKSRENLFW